MKAYTVTLTLLFLPANGLSWGSEPSCCSGSGFSSGQSDISRHPSAFEGVGEVCGKPAWWSSIYYLVSGHCSRSGLSFGAGLSG